MAYRALGLLVWMTVTYQPEYALAANSGTCDVNINKPRTQEFQKNLDKIEVQDANPEFWRNQARATLKEAKELAENLDTTTRAKNMIIFIGDGMSIQTVVGSRILKGQKNDMPGEEGFLSFEKFPYVGMSKTYNVNSQVPDCGSSATAILTGVKTKNSMIGLSGKATPGDCSSAVGNEVDSILKLAKDANWNVGLVTTAALVNSTPAAAYAHTPDETWKYDVPADQGPCKDIATQFVNSNFLIDVALGGGRSYFMRTDQSDPETPGSKGKRTDNVDLIAKWKDRYSKISGTTSRYVTNKGDLMSLSSSTDYVLGMFHPSDMSYNDRKSDSEPSLSEMVEKALQLLQNKNKQYLLFVEGANIDKGHHENKAGQALHETLEMDAAVEKALAVTDPKDTMMVVTADHSHTMTMAGYPCRGQPILGKVYGKEEFADITDDKPYTQLGYSNGPSAIGVQASLLAGNGRPRIDGVDTEDLDYQAQSLIPLAEETHGGEDVQIFVSGPMSHLAQGVHDQTYVNAMMLYAGCLGRHRTTSCQQY